jgi:hypothetical protein
VTRTRLPNRRPGNTVTVPFEISDGKVVKLQVTFGFNAAWEVCEVFCADFKAGSSLHAMVMDSCILLSRLFQHGDQPNAIAGTLSGSSKFSLVKVLALAAAEEDRRMKELHKQEQQ